MRFLLIAAALLAATSPAFAGRSLVEPKGVRDVVKRTPRAELDKALSEAGVKERCTDATLRSLDLGGLGCRLVVHTAVAGRKAPSTVKEVQARVAAAEEAHAAALTIATFEPLTKPPRLSEDRFFAHQRACQGLIDAWDTLRAVPKASSPEVRAAVDAGLQQTRFQDQRLSEVACGCTAQSLDFAQAAGVSPELTGALQGTLTSRGCFLDESKIRAERGGPESRFSGRAKAISEQSTDEAQVAAFAKTRDVGLSRCRDKYLAKGTLADGDGMEKCACGEIQRWSFPKKKGRPDLSVRLPLYDDRLGVRVGVSAPGKVTSCGPLEGPLTN